MHNYMKSRDTILFDLDGTLTDPKVGITKSVQYALSSFGIYVEDLDSLCKFIGPPLKDSFIRYYGFDDTLARTAVDKYREYFRDTGIFENAIYPGIAELLHRISSDGRQLIVETSKPIVFAERILEYFNIAEYFSFVCGSELDGTRVKKSEVIRYALEQAAITDLDKVVMVGDREHDVVGAKEVGIACIGVLFGYGSRGELEEAGADIIVETVKELGRIL